MDENLGIFLLRPYPQKTFDIGKALSLIYFLFYARQEVSEIDFLYTEAPPPVEMFPGSTVSDNSTKFIPYNFLLKKGGIQGRGCHFSVLQLYTSTC
jgi:hypothetical protein